jgi:hypothetical protein
MSYDIYFFTGVIASGTRFIARYDGEFVGAFDTWKDANDALKKRIRS